MQVFVRQPFSVHLEKILETEAQNGTVTREKVVTPHFSNKNKSPIDLSPEDVLIHLHKLEPVDDEAKKFFAAYHAEKDRGLATTQVDGPTSEERVASAVIAALVTAGVIKPAAAEKAGK